MIFLSISLNFSFKKSIDSLSISTKKDSLFKSIICSVRMPIPGPTSKGQILAGDAVYFKNLGLNDKNENFSFEKLIKYLFLLEIYFMEDTAYDLVLNSKKIIEKNTDRSYVEFLNFFH